MGVFKKTSKYRKLPTISEKEKFLNAELVKTGMLDENAPANSTSGVYFQTGPAEENDDIADLKAAALEAAGVTDFEYLPQEGGSTSPDGTTRNNLFQGWGNWGPEDTPTMWWKNASGQWNWMAWIPYNFYTQNPDGERLDGGGWGIHSSTMFGAVGVPGVGGGGAGSVPSEIEAKIKDENGDYITPDKFEAPPHIPVIFQGGLGDPDYFPGDPQKDEDEDEEEIKQRIKNQLGVGDSGLNWIEDQASQDSEEGYTREYEGKDNEDAEEEEDKEEEKKEEPKNSFLDAAVKEGGSNFWQRTWEVVKGIGDTLWDTSKAIANLKPSTLLMDIFNDSNEHETTSVNTATSYNLALMRSMVTTVVTGQNQKIELTNTAVKDLLKSIDPVEMERNIQIGPPPEISSDNAINPGEGKSDKILKGSWAAQGGVEIHFNPDDGNFTVTAAKMLRDFGDLDKAGDLHDIPNPTTEQLVNMMKDKGLHEPLNNFYKHVADSGFLGSAVNTRQVANAISSLASFAAGVDKNNPFGDKAYKAYGHTADEAAEVMQKAFPEAIKAIYNFTVEGTAANAVKMREALVNAGLPETEIEKEGEGFGGFVYSQETVAFEDLPRDVQWHVMNKFENVNGDISPHNSGRMGKTYKQAISDHKRGINKHGHITDPELQEEKYKSQGNVLAEGWHSPEHVNVDKNERKRWFNPKDIAPEYPEKAPPEQVDGWHPKLKKKEEAPVPTKQYIKITEKDLLKNHRLKDKERKEFMKTINAINSYLTKNPSALVHAQQRYPRTDPHLAALNYKMDTMLGASKEFMDKKYPENKRLFNQLQKSVKRSIKLTNPSTFKVKIGKQTSYKKLLNVNYVDNIYDKVTKTETKVKRKKNKKSAARFFRKEKPKRKSQLKEEFLNAELKKTGMLDENAPANSTSSVYSMPIEQENEKYAAINAITYGGQNIVFHHAEVEGGIKSPDGKRTAMTNAGMSQMTKTRPGWRATPQSRMHGTVIWYWDPNMDNIPPEPDGGWAYLEWGVNPYPDYQPGFGYWTSGALGFLMHSNENVPADLKAALADYASAEAQEELKKGPTHIVLDREGTNDMFNPYPGNKDKEKKSEEEEARAQLGLGQAAWDWLKDQVENLGDFAMDPYGNTLDAIGNALADALDAKGAKQVLDRYMDFLNNGDENSEGSTRENPMDIGDLVNDDVAAPKLKDWWLENKDDIMNPELPDEGNYSLQNTITGNSTLNNVLGNLDFKRGDGVEVNEDEGTVTIKKAYDFDGFSDLVGGDWKTASGALAYGTLKGLPLHMKDAEGNINFSKEGVTPPAYMAITLDIETGEIVPKPKQKGQQNESYLSEGWHSPEHVNVDKDEKKRWFNPKDIQPEYPEKAPPEQVDGWHPDLKKKEETPISIKQYIKIKEVDLIKNHKLKDNEVKEFTKTINAINSYLTKNPSALIHAQQRYPKSDPHLAALNYKMDTMLAASKDFMDKKYPENTRLFNQLHKSVKRSIKLTDPKTFKVELGKETSYKKLLRVNYVENIYDKVSRTEKKVKRKKNKKSASRFFRKEKPKTKSELIDLRLKQLEIDMQKTLTNP